MSAGEQTQMRAVVLESNMAGIEEFGELWFVCIKAKMDRMTLCADRTQCCIALMLTEHERRSCMRGRGREGLDETM